MGWQKKFPDNTIVDQNDTTIIFDPDAKIGPGDLFVVYDDSSGISTIEECFKNELGKIIADGGHKYQVWDCAKVIDFV